MRTTTTLTDAAVEHATNGLSVIAVGNNKRPFATWKHRQTTPGRPEDVCAEMADSRATGFAVIGGKVSGGLEILDFDVPGFYEAWCEAVGEIIMRLPVQRTGGGGYQVAYRCDDPLPNTKLAYSPSDEHKDGREIAIETRGEGGYAVVAPSQHPSGNRYEYITGQTFADAPLLSVAEVEFLRFAARQQCKAPQSKREQQARAERQTKAKPIDRSKLNGEVSVIDRWNKEVPISTMLERCGYTKDPRSNEYTRPGPDASPGGVAVFDDGRSYHHSTNDIMHDGQHSVDSFELLKVYEYGGDTSKAVRGAARELGIEPTPKAAQDVSRATQTRNHGSPLSIASLIAQHPTLSEPVIDGLLRTGETANVIAASKVGKSWLMYALLICLATGRRWLDTFDCNAGPVLLIDNELHPQTIADRLPKVARAMGTKVPADIDVLALRGQGVTLDVLRNYIDKIEQGHYQVIVLDAWYRFIPQGMSENSNADVMHLYNMLDEYAAKTGAAIVAVHHASKGGQGDKAVTDVGAGAGAQSRAADAHVVLRPHEDEGCIVLEAAVRSFAPVEPVGLRWEFPLWNRTEDINTDALKDRKTKQEQRAAQNDAEGIHKIVETLRARGPLTTSKLCLNADGMGYARAKRLLGRMLGANTVTYKDVRVRGQDAQEWSLAE